MTQEESQQKHRFKKTRYSEALLRLVCLILCQKQSTSSFYFPGAGVKTKLVAPEPRQLISGRRAWADSTPLGAVVAVDGAGATSSTGLPWSGHGVELFRSSVEKALFCSCMDWLGAEVFTLCRCCHQKSHLSMPIGNVPTSASFRSLSGVDQNLL